MLVNQAIYRRAVKLFNEIDITDLSLSAVSYFYLLSDDLVTINDGLNNFIIVCECRQVCNHTGAIPPSSLSTPIARAG